MYNNETSCSTLKCVPLLPACSIKQRAEVIQQLLQDRDAAVADAAAKMLAHWLAQDCSGDPLQLLQLLDVETYTGDKQNILHAQMSTLTSAAPED
jgi:hypothetical protein